MGETCWSFSTAGAVEGAIVAIGKGSLTPLSNQYLIDCMEIQCSDSSGTMNDAFDWIAKNNKGYLYSQSSYPYIDQDCMYWDPPHDCLSNGTLVSGLSVTGHQHTISGDEADLMAAVAQQPVSIAIYSGLASFTTYSGGIYNDKECEGVTAAQLDHAVLLVGYGTEGGKDYWIVKNSWTSDWGEQGYIRMARNVGKGGMCGLAIDASYPTLQ
jgi:cathepsin L